MSYYHLVYTSRSNPLHYFDGLVEYSCNNQYATLKVCHITSHSDPALDDLKVGDAFVFLPYTEEKSSVYLYEWKSAATRTSHYFDISYQNSNSPNTVLSPVSARYVHLQQRRVALREELVQVEEELSKLRYDKTDFVYEKVQESNVI
jgi:hypothetical protein